MINLSFGHLFHFFFHTCSSQDRGVSKEGLKLTLEDLPSYKSLFWGIQHLFVEKGFILLDLPWVQKSRFKHLLIHKRIIPCSSGIYCRDARFLNSHKLITMIHHINSWRLKTICLKKKIKVKNWAEPKCVIIRDWLGKLL